jgi:hypothetical protein
LKKLRRAEGGAKIVGVFRVKNHDFTPKNHIFSNFRNIYDGNCKGEKNIIVSIHAQIKEQHNVDRFGFYFPEGIPRDIEI